MIALLYRQLDKTDYNYNKQQQRNAENHRDEEGEDKDKWSTHVLELKFYELAEPLILRERGDAGEGFAFEEFEAGSAAGRDVRDAAGYA